MDGSEISGKLNNLKIERSESGAKLHQNDSLPINTLVIKWMALEAMDFSPFTLTLSGICVNKFICAYF